jgi:hypothetical protein
MADDVVERIAAIIDPVWMNPPDGPHLLENYPGQADAYRAKAREKAEKVLAAQAAIEATPLRELREALVNARERVAAYGYSRQHGRRVRQHWAKELLAKIDQALAQEQSLLNGDVSNAG